MKKCPFCAEDIQEEAVKCRFCGEFLDVALASKTKWYYSTSIIILALISVGPFALPLVWFHPQYNRVTKIILTIVITGFSIWIFLITRDLYVTLMQQLKAFGL